MECVVVCINSTWGGRQTDGIMSAHKKLFIAHHSIMVDDETFAMIEELRGKTESKGEALKRILLQKGGEVKV